MQSKLKETKAECQLSWILKKKILEEPMFHNLDYCSVRFLDNAV